MNTNCLCREIILVVIMSVIIISCKKHNAPIQPESDVVVPTSRAYYSTASLLSDSVMQIVQGLFKRNNLSMANLQPYRLDQDNYGFTHICCNQIQYGLKLFFYQSNFHFKADTLTSISGDKVNGFMIDTVPRTSLTKASTLFYNAIKEDIWYSDSLNSFVNHEFSAKLGFYDLYIFVGRSEKRFVLAWELSVKNTRRYPIAYIRADTASMINYSNGVIIN